MGTTKFGCKGLLLRIGSVMSSGLPAVLCAQREKVIVEMDLCCRHFTWFRGRCPFREAHAGIRPCCLRAAPQSTALYFLFCRWQPAVGGEWHIRPPRDPPWGPHNPPSWSPDIQAGTATHACCHTSHQCINAAPRWHFLPFCLQSIPNPVGRTMVHQSCLQAGSTGSAVCTRHGEVVLMLCTSISC